MRASSLPNLQFTPVTGGAPVSLEAPPRCALVVVIIHSTTCSECLAFVNKLAKVREELAAWDGTVVVVAGQTSGNGDPAAAFTTLLDPEHALAAALGLTVGAVIVADQWHEIRQLWQAGSAHGWPATADIVSWIRYLAIQCPECEGEAL